MLWSHSPRGCFLTNFKSVISKHLLRINLVTTFCEFALRWTPFMKSHDEGIKWKHFPRYWPSVWGIHRWTMNSPHKGQWRGALLDMCMNKWLSKQSRRWWVGLTKASDAGLWYFLWSAPWINGWVDNREAGDLRRHRTHYDVNVMVNTGFGTGLGLSGNSPLKKPVLTRSTCMSPYGVPRPHCTTPWQNRQRNWLGISLSHQA